MNMCLQDSVEHYMIKYVLTVEPEDSVLTAIRIIVNGVDQLPVVDGKRQLVGIITWRDISEKVILKRRDPKKARIQTVMKKTVTSLSPKHSIKEALKLLTAGQYSLPVVENKRLVGLLSSMDILKSYLNTVDQ